MKTYETATEMAEDWLAVLCGDTLNKLGLDGRTYEDGVEVTFTRKVPGESD